MRSIFSGSSRRSLMVRAAAAVLAGTFGVFGLAGCGGGAGGTEPAAVVPPQAETGSLTIAITDAEGDFLTYAVDVKSIRLHRTNGDIVETLPLTTRIDFAELTQVTEFLTTSTVPLGAYDEVLLTLDYSNADVQIQDADGNAVVAQVRDANGQPLTELTVKLMLTERDRVVISRGVPAAFTLDFDLAASNTVQLSPPVVTVSPVLIATAEFENDRPHRVHGALADVNIAENVFVLKVRPFHHRDSRFGELRVFVDGDTVYEINGQAFVGSDGLAAMDRLDDNTAVAALGSVAARKFVADTVVAGSSVPGASRDAVLGVVMARSGNTLTVHGGRVRMKDGRHMFRGRFQVLVSDNTAVSALIRDAGTLSDDSISVGQSITAFGTVSDQSNVRTLDASNGRVHLNVTEIIGDVVALNPLAMDLHFINGRRPDNYDFSGTGISSGDDADPAHYEVDTTGLSLPLAEGDLVKVRGLVNDFGMAPPDFDAHTLINLQLDARAAELLIAWPNGSATAFSAISSTSLSLNTADARVLFHIRGVSRPFSSTDALRAIVAADDGLGAFAVRVVGTRELQVFRTFVGLTEALQAHLDGGARVLRVTAGGQYNRATQQLVSKRVAVELTSARQ